MGITIVYYEANIKLQFLCKYQHVKNVAHIKICVVYFPHTLIPYK
jgi:hypothetical protein